MSTPSSNKPRKRVSKNSFTTKSGKTIKVHRGISDKIQAAHDNRARRRASRLATLPKNRWKRMLYRLQPKRLAQYWFSRDGLIMALKITGIGVATGFVVLIGLFAYFRKDLPKITDISGNKLGGSITYYDRTGNTVLWQDYDAVKRVQVSGDNINRYMKDATVAIEDKNFFNEGAFDVRGIARAAAHDALSSGGGTQGASTITEQVVKLNENWNGNRTITTKVKELILAVELEREYSKTDILTGYLNIAPYGGVEYGVQSAAQDYFGVDAKDLSLPQAAMLAAIPQDPPYYSPFSDPTYNPGATENDFGQQALLDRQHYILDQMAAQGYITKAQATAAKSVDILAQVHPLQDKYAGIKAPYFVLAAKQELENKYGAATVQRGGWKVITTLDMNLQTKDEQLIASNLPAVQRKTDGLADEEANVTEDVQTGQIVALVGGVDFTKVGYGQNNYAAGVLIPPGSSFKPYDYSTLINNNTNVGAGSVLYDTESPLPGYSCTDHSKPPPNGTGNCLTDYDFLQPGPLTLRYALGGSRNIPAVKAMLSAVPNAQCAQNVLSACVPSINKVISTADAMMDNPYNPNAYNCYQEGVDINSATPADVAQCYDAAAIGDGAFLHLDDHVNGLSTLARLGTAIPRTFLLKITDATGKNVELPTYKPQQILQPDTAYILDNMASDPNASYLPGSCSATNCSLNPGAGYKFQRYQGWDFAVKTGTTNDGFDGLMTSWSTQYATVSWVGNHTRNVDIQAKTGAAMETLTEPLTEGMMAAAHTGKTPVNWTQPSDIKVLPAFVVRNKIHYGDVEPSPSSDLFPSWYVAPAKASSTTQTTDKVSGLVATSCTPDDAKQTQAGGNDSSFSIDLFYPPGKASSNSATSATTSDNVHSCSDQQPPNQLPTPTLTVDDSSGNAISADSSGNYDCTSSCQIVTTMDFSSVPANTGGSSPHSRFPVTVSLLSGGQVVSSQSVTAPGPTTLTFDVSPPSSGTSQLAIQATDAALYQSTSGTVNVAQVQATTPPTTPTR